MGEELPESYIKKEKEIPKTGYEKKIILKSKEKTNSESSSISNLVKTRELPSANFYFSDEEEDKNIGTPRQFNPISKSDKTSKNTDILIENSPRAISNDKSDDDDEKTIEFKNIIFNDTINSYNDNSYTSEEKLISSDSSLNSINENGYYFLNSNDSNFKYNDEKVKNQKTVVFDNPSKEKHKKYKIPLKETFSGTFSKAILKPISKNTYFNKESTVKEKEEELPFSVVYSVWKLQKKFKDRKQEKIIIQ